ncbi:MAG: nuclear transport factor 2 family protein [Pyrinomonadaceae bacterium]|nr:nuclear transport factor 2 family protein [Pyrinomonadaceae bacterium]
MKGITLFILMTAASVFFAACGAPATNNANSNANTTRPTAAAPTADALLALDKQANEAYIKGDSKFFEGFLSDKFVMLEGGARLSKADAVKMIGGVKCEVKEGWALTEPQMAKIDNDTYALSYKTNMEGSCTADGKTEKLPSPARAATVWVRNGDKWQAVFHGENLIIDPKNLSKAPAAPPAKPADKKDDKAATDAKPAKPAADPITDALMAAEKAVWEAWKAHDAKKLEDLTTRDMSFVNIFGDYFATKADAIKDWTSGRCYVKSVTLTDGVGTSLSPTIGILTSKGTVDGTCNGQKPGPVYATSVYVKDGDAWKWAFGFNSF